MDAFVERALSMPYTALMNECRVIDVYSNCITRFNNKKLLEVHFKMLFPEERSEDCRNLN